MPLTVRATARTTATLVTAGVALASLPVPALARSAPARHGGQIISVGPTKQS
jgi:hypothetical protein